MTYPAAAVVNKSQQKPVRERRILQSLLMSMKSTEAFTPTDPFTVSTERRRAQAGARASWS